MKKQINIKIVEWILIPILVGILLLFIEKIFFEPKQDLNTNKLTTDKKDHNIESVKPPQSKVQKTYDVILVLPSRMSDANVFVDEKKALIVERTLTVIKIRVSEKTTNHKITVRNGNDSCSIEKLIRQNNERISLCTQ